MITEQELRSIFDALDSDRDGKLSINEFLNEPGISLLLEYKTDTFSFEELLAQCDLDKDGSVTFEELKETVEKTCFLK